jgi:hypothetical protein
MALEAGLVGAAEDDRQGERLVPGAGRGREARRGGDGGGHVPGKPNGRERRYGVRRDTQYHGGRQSDRDGLALLHLSVLLRVVGATARPTRKAVSTPLGGPKARAD